MKIVKFKGGLGNQLFQYAFARHISDMFGEEVLFDSQTDKDNLEITRLSAECKFADEKAVKRAVMLKGFRVASRTKRKIFAAVNSFFNPKYFFEKSREEVNVLKLKNKTYFDGYWQCRNYLENRKEELYQAFKPKSGFSEKALKDIAFASSKQTVCLGIRLGDYTAESRHYMVCGGEYYKNAIEYCLKNIENPLFYVFSNDVDGAKEIMAEFDGRAEVKYREESDVLVNYEEMWVMAACKHAIIPNSTFHWWAAYLKQGDGNLIIAPKTWFGDGKKIDIVPDGWVTI